MPTVLRWGSYRAFFFSNERNEPAHVHVRSGDKEVKIWLHDLTVAVNAGFPAHEIGSIILLPDDQLVIAGLVPAISIERASPCLFNRDHRDSPLRAGPVMTK